MIGCCHSCDATSFSHSPCSIQVQIIASCIPSYSLMCNISQMIQHLILLPDKKKHPAAAVWSAFPLVVKSVLNSSSSCSSSLCLHCLFLCCFCPLCALRIMMKGQGWTEWAYSDCTVTEAINCWCRGRGGWVRRK